MNHSYSSSVLQIVWGPLLLFLLHNSLVPLQLSSAGLLWTKFCRYFKQRKCPPFKNEHLCCNSQHSGAMFKSRAHKHLQIPPVSKNNDFHLVEPVIKSYPLYSFTYCLNSEKRQHGMTTYFHRGWKLSQQNKVLKESPQNKTCSRTFSSDASNKSTGTSKWVGRARKGWHRDR